MLTSQIADRRWLQWSLRSLLVVVVLLAIVFAWWGAKVRRETRIQNAVRLVAASPGWWPSDDYDPIALVRAVNALHTLGKRDAIIALRRFAKEYPSAGGPEDRHESLRVIVPLLFDRETPEDRFPERSPGDKWWTHLGATEWPFFSPYLRVMDDIPFQIVSGMGFSGGMDDFSYAIDWAEKHGRFRSSMLRPADSPFAAADRLDLEVRRMANGSEHKLPNSPSQIIRHVREQVAIAIAHLMPPSEIDQYRYVKNWNSSELSDNYRDLENEANWEQLQKTCSSLEIRWSEQHQAYVSTNRP